MATKMTNTQDNPFNDVNALDDDALLQIEKDLKEKMAKITEAKKGREENLKNTAFKEINTVIDKYITIIPKAEFSTWLIENNYIDAVKKGNQGRRKINDADILFQREYFPEGAKTKYTLKLDANSKLPTPTSKAMEAIEEFRKLSYSDLKTSFTPLFFKKFKEENHIRDWTEEFFDDVFKYLVIKEEEDEEFDKANQQKEKEKETV